MWLICVQTRGTIEFWDFSALNLSNRGQQSAGFSLSETPDSFHQRLNESVWVCVQLISGTAMFLKYDSGHI